MANIYQAIESAKRMTSDSITVLQNMAGAYAHGQDDVKACASDQAAALLDGAILLMDEAVKRMREASA